MDEPSLSRNAQRHRARRLRQKARKEAAIGASAVRGGLPGVENLNLRSIPAIIAGYVDADAVVPVVGPEQTGKSQLIVALLAAGSNGRPPWDFGPRLARPFKSVLLTYEDTLPTTTGRCSAMHVRPGMVHIPTDETGQQCKQIHWSDHAEIERLITRWGASVVGIDMFKNMLDKPTDLMHPAAMTKLWTYLRDLCRSYHVSLIPNFHSKAKFGRPEELIEGTRETRRAMRSGLFAAPVDRRGRTGRRLLVPMKANEGIPAPAIGYRIVSAVGRIRLDGQMQDVNVGVPLFDGAYDLDVQAVINLYNMAQDQKAVIGLENPWTSYDDLIDIFLESKRIPVSRTPQEQPDEATMKNVTNTVEKVHHYLALVEKQNWNNK